MEKVWMCTSGDGRICRSEDGGILQIWRRCVWICSHLEMEGSADLKMVGFCRYGEGVDV